MVTRECARWERADSARECARPPGSDRLPAAMAGQTNPLARQTEGMMIMEISDVARTTALASPGGFTVDPRTGTLPASGYMVAIPGHETRVRDAWSAQHAIADALTDPIFAEPGIWLGGWQESADTLLIEPAVNIADRNTAVILGRIWDQVSIWDVSEGEEIAL